MAKINGIRIKNFKVLRDVTIGKLWSLQRIDEGKKKLDLFGLIDLIQKDDDKEESRETEVVELEDKRKLGVSTLGSLKQHPRISAFRRFVEGWYLSCFTPDAARGLPLAGPQKHLNIHGDNLGNVVQFMEREHPTRFQSILKRIARKIPGVDRIDTSKTPDGRLLLRFNDKGFNDPFYAQQMSDGTLKLFAYLLLLEDPAPPTPGSGFCWKICRGCSKEGRPRCPSTAGRLSAPRKRNGRKKFHRIWTSR